MAHRDPRRVLITGAMALMIQHSGRRGKITDPWLARMLVIVALATGMTRLVWALTTKKEIYLGRAAT